MFNSFSSKIISAEKAVIERVSESVQGLSSFIYGWMPLRVDRYNERSFMIKGCLKCEWSGETDPSCTSVWTCSFEECLGSASFEVEGKFPFSLKAEFGKRNWARTGCKSVYVGLGVLKSRHFQFSQVDPYSGKKFTLIIELQSF